MVRAGRLRAVAANLAMAFVAAALGNALVESLANAGLFGTAHRDDVHQSVAPVLAVGLAIAVLLAMRFVARALQSARRSPQQTIRSLASAVHRASSPRALAAAFAVQLALLNGMERAEAAWFGGDPVAGCSWLGGPPAIALLVQFSVLVLCASVARRAVRALLAGAVTALCLAYERVIAARARASARPFACIDDAGGIIRTELVVARRLRGRAPPILATIV